jgi:hypothetical protein
MFGFALLLLMIAGMPWFVSSCTVEPILPEELRLEPTTFQETVSALQDHGGDDQRKTPSTIQVVPLGTVPPKDVPTSTPISIEITSTPEQTEEPVSEEMKEDDAPAQDPSNQAESTDSTPASVVVRVQTSVAVETPVPTTRVLIVRSESAALTTIPGGTESETMTTTETLTDINVLAVPPNMVSTEDLITEEMLSEQIQHDAADPTLSDLRITLLPEGVRAEGAITLIGGIQQPLTVEGGFAVENQSLVAQIESIYLGSLNVTDRYKSQLEAGINSSLYRLLPQRYVESFSLSQ